MVFIIGGAFQGKMEYALKNYGLNENDIYKSSDINDIFNAGLITDYHLIIKKMMSDNIDPVEMTKRVCIDNKNAVIIMDEIGCGIIPVDKSEREWRENTGRCGCILSRNAEKVIRIICGIPIVLKEKL